MRIETMPTPGIVAGRVRNGVIIWLLPMVAIAVLGAARLAYPFHGDQALFMLGARTLAGGGTLYVDFWDCKQPGIYLLYLLAGRFFGFDEIGVHLFELVWNLGWAAAVISTTRSWFTRDWLRMVAPLAVIAPYYAAAGSWHLTQIEGLANLPLVACLAFAVTAAQGRNRVALMMAASGLCAGVVVSLKLILAPLPAAFWLVALAWAYRERRIGIVEASVRFILPAAIGMLVPLVVLLLWFAARGALEALFWTNLVYPGEALRTAPMQSPKILLSSLWWLLQMFAPWFVPALVALVAGWWSRDLLCWMLTAWLAIGGVAVLIQALSWWPYHFLLFCTPIGLLGTKGLDVAIARLRANGGTRRAARLATAVALGILFAPTLVTWAGKANAALAMDAFASEHRVAFQRAVDPDFDSAWREARIIGDVNAHPGTIYVFGTPVLVLLSGRRQAIAVHGWSWELLLPRHWAMLPGQLARASPTYVYVSEFYAPLIARNSPDTLGLLERDYETLSSSAAGTWFRRRDRTSVSFGECHGEPGRRDRC